MVRVFRCHCFASKQVIPITVEPLTICASGDKIFVATSDCEILVFNVSDGTSFETQRLPTISQVERIIFNPFKNYIATVEQKKSWKKMTHSVRVYLNWEKADNKSSKPRTKVRVAGKSHVQHVSSASNQNVMEIIEIPVDKHATGIAVCSQTGNFAVACGPEVKLCSVVEKTVGNSDKTYLDVEIFLELCWNFSVQSITLCEEFVVCCSKTEVQGIRVRYDEGIEPSIRGLRRSLTSPIASQDSGSAKGSQRDNIQDGALMSPYSTSPKSMMSESDVFAVNVVGDYDNLDSKVRFRQRSLNSLNAESNRDLSTVGRRPTVTICPRTGVHALTDKPTLPNDDENFVEWNFWQPQSSSNVTCLPGLHTDRGRSQCHRHFQSVSPPVLSDFSGGKVKSSSGVQAETVLYLNDVSEKEEWMRCYLIPSYAPGPGQLLHVATGTDRMASARNASRTSVCCFVSGMRSGYLYQLSPFLNKVSTYQYTDKASQVFCGDQHLYVVTHSGIETYTSRWAAVAMESKNRGPWHEESSDYAHPPSSLDICLCGHEPLLGVVDMCSGKNFVGLLSKMEYASSSDETVWSFYIVHCQSIVDQCKDMLQFAENVRITGPSSYIHLLQEAHLLLSTFAIHNNGKDAEIELCLNKVKKLLGDVYAQPGEEGWRFCHSYYDSLGISTDTVVKQVLEMTDQKKRVEYGKGLLDFLDKRLFSEESDTSLLPSPSIAEDILSIYAVASPDKLSKIVLLSNLSGYKPDLALSHLKKWLSLKSGSSLSVSTIDKLAIVQVHLTLCEVELACSELDSIGSCDLMEVCCSHPGLLHKDLKSFTPLGQLMRWHKPTCMMEILVEMLDQGLLSLDSLLVLLQSQDQSDIHHNSHVKQVLELILTDDKRGYIFEEAVNLLCEIYIAQLKDKKTKNCRPICQKGQVKFSLPHGNGHFAPRFGWLDELPPFYGCEEMLRPCRNLDMKRVMNQGSRVNSKPITITPRQDEKIECPCCLCNENLLKLQSLLCSPKLTLILARHILNLLRDDEDEIGQMSYTFQDLDVCWDSVQLLCLSKIDLTMATEQVVYRYPLVLANFSSLCYQGDVAKYSFLLHCMENVLKKCSTTKPAQGEQVYVKAYKELLNRLAELFPPSQFVHLLPKDGNLYFLLPFVTNNLELESSNSLKCNIIKMGKELLSQIC